MRTLAGFFPGSLEEKFAPWAAPVIEAIKERIGSAAYDIALKNGDIEMVPFEVMRGRSWKDAFILFDEAQNATLSEMKTFLTRIGEDCTVVVNGDVSQCDLRETSGLRTVHPPDQIEDAARAGHRIHDSTTLSARAFARCGCGLSRRRISQGEPSYRGQGRLEPYRPSGSDASSSLCKVPARPKRPGPTGTFGRKSMVDI